MVAADAGPGAKSPPPLCGLVLAGGRGSRLQADKGELDYHGEPQARWAFSLLQGLCERCFVSIRPDQAGRPAYSGLPVILDRVEDEGPASGLRAALEYLPVAAWLVVATDMPLLNIDVLTTLVHHRDSTACATAYRRRDGTIEPLCAIWEPVVRSVIARSAPGKTSLRRLLEAGHVRWLELADETALDSVNTALEDSRIRQRLASR